MADMTEEEIRKMEADIRLKEIEQEKAKKLEIEKLLDDAVVRGKAQALEAFEAERARERAEEERQALIAKTASLEAELKRTQEASLKKMEEMSKLMEEKFQSLESRPRGIVRNESPFAGTTPTPLSQLSREEVKAIEQASMEAFYAKLGRPVPY